jgi:hypothetical protein
MTSPSLEKIVALKPDLVLADSIHEDSGKETRRAGYFGGGGFSFGFRRGANRYSLDWDSHRGQGSEQWNWKQS